MTDAKQGEPWAWAVVTGEDHVEAVYFGDMGSDRAYSTVQYDYSSKQDVSVVPLYPPSPAREALERLCQAIEERVDFMSKDGFMTESLRAALASARETLGTSKEKP